MVVQTILSYCRGMKAGNSLGVGLFGELQTCHRWSLKTHESGGPVSLRAQAQADRVRLVRRSELVAGVAI